MNLIGIAAASVVGFGAFLLADGLSEQVTDAQSEGQYIAARALVVDIDSRTVTQNPAVSSRDGHVLAGWEASISDPVTNEVYCAGSAGIGSASYGVWDNPRPYTFSEWTGDNCPDEMEPPLRFYAKWRHQISGQTLGADVEVIVEY